MDLSELHLPRTVAYVGLARAVVTAGARLAALPEERLEDLKIAVSEAFAHALKAVGDDQMVIAFGVHRDAFEVHVLDRAFQGLTPGGSQSDRGWPDEGGLGLTLMQGLADEVLFPDASSSQLVLRFGLHGAGDHATAAADSSPAR